MFCLLKKMKTRNDLVVSRLRIKYAKTTYFFFADGTDNLSGSAAAGFATGGAGVIAGTTAGVVAVAGD